MLGSILGSPNLGELPYGTSEEFMRGTLGIRQGVLCCFGWMAYRSDS